MMSVFISIVFILSILPLVVYGLSKADDNARAINIKEQEARLSSFLESRTMSLLYDTDWHNLRVEDYQYGILLELTMNVGEYASLLVKVNERGCSTYSVRSQYIKKDDWGNITQEMSGDYILNGKHFNDLHDLIQEYKFDLKMAGGLDA